MFGIIHYHFIYIHFVRKIYNNDSDKFIIGRIELVVVDKTLLALFLKKERKKENYKVIDLK